MSDCYYCGSEIRGASINKKHPQCDSDQLMHRHPDVIFSRQNIAAWMRERAEKIREIGVLTGEEEVAMSIALNIAAMAGQIEDGAIAKWVRERDIEVPYICPCWLCEHGRKRKGKAAS